MICRVDVKSGVQRVIENNVNNEVVASEGSEQSKIASAVGIFDDDRMSEPKPEPARGREGGEKNVVGNWSFFVQVRPRSGNQEVRKSGTSGVARSFRVV